VYSMRDETLLEIKHLTKELLDLLTEEMNESHPDASEVARVFAWYQMVIHVVQFILESANAVLEVYSRSQES